MSEPGHEHVPRPGDNPAVPAALSVAIIGEVLALVAGATASAALSIASLGGVACCIIAIATLSELAPADPRARHAVTALLGGHGLAVALLLSGTVPGAPAAPVLVALAAAATLGGAGLVVVGRRSIASRSPRLLVLTPRVAAIALVVQAVLQLSTLSSTAPASPLRTAEFALLAALGVVELVCLSVIALQMRRRWVIAGLAAWAVGWVASMADVSALISWSLGAPFPIGRHQLHALDADLVQTVATLGGLAIGLALVTAIRESRFRHSAMILLAGYVVFGLVVAVGEHRIDLAVGYPSIVALRKDRDLADALTAFALAGMLWLYWRRVVATSLPAAAAWRARS